MDRRPRLVGLIALVMHLAVGVVPYLGSGLVAPTYGVAVLWSIWLALLGLGIWLWRTNPRWAWGVPAGALAAWVLVVTLGEVLLDWTA